METNQNPNTMKKFFVIALGFLWGLKASTQPAVLIAEYRFEFPAGVGVNTPYYTNPLLITSASSMGVGAGLSDVTYFNGPTGGAANRAKASTNWTPAFSLLKYFGFTLNPIGGNTLVIDSINFWGARSSQGPSSIEIRTSADGFAPNAWLGTNPATPAMGTPVWGRQSRTSGLPSTTGPLTTRIYLYGTTNAGTTWRTDTVRIYGHLDGVFNLPVELTSFTGRAVENGVRLDWATASETDNDYFTVLRSRDAETWHEVDRVDGAGESQAEIRYRLLDASPEIGLNYYKLRQTDYEDAFEDSKVIAITWQPFDPSEAQVFDAEGKFIRNWDGDVFGLAPGTYVLRDKYNNTKKIFAPP